MAINMTTSRPSPPMMFRTSVLRLSPITSFRFASQSIVTAINGLPMTVRAWPKIIASIFLMGVCRTIIATAIPTSRTTTVKRRDQRSLNLAGLPTPSAKILPPIIALMTKGFIATANSPTQKSTWVVVPSSGRSCVANTLISLAG